MEKQIADKKVAHGKKKSMSIQATVVLKKTINIKIKIKTIYLKIQEIDATNLVYRVKVNLLIL